MQGLEWTPAKEQRDFSLRFEMTAGYHQVLLPIGNTLRPNNLCRLALPPLSSRPTPAVIAPYPHCHLDLPPLSSRPTPAVISTAGRDLNRIRSQRKHKISRFASK